MKKMALTGALLLAAPVAGAVDWEFDTALSASLIHTNNVALAPADNEQSDTIMLLSPVFSLTGESNRLDLDFRYNPQGVFYDNTDDADQVFHVLDGSLTGEVMDDRLFVTVNAAKFQTIVTPEGAFPLDNVPASNNRADSTVLTINPFWQQDLGSTQLRIDAAHTRTEFDDESLGDAQIFLQSNRANTAGFNWGSRPAERGFTWAVDYDYTRLEYDDAIPFEFQRGTLQLGMWVNEDTRVFVTGGRETPFDAFLDGSPDDSLWEAGMQYAPNERLNVEVAAGERSFGATARAAMTFNTRRSATTLAYTETPTAQGALFGGRQPLRDIDNLNALLDRPGDTDRMVQKRGELRTTVNLNRTTIDWRIFTERRTDRTTAEGAPLPTDELQGAAFRFDWRFGARTSVNVNADIAELDGIQDGDFWRAGVGFVYSLSSRVTLAFNVEHIEQNGAGAGLGGGGGTGGNGAGFDVDRATLTIGMQL